LIIFREGWSRLNPNDPRRALADEVVPAIRGRWHSIVSARKDAA
jgi:hypothetical protein